MSPTMATSRQPFRALLCTVGLLFVGGLLYPISVHANGLLDLADIIAHPDQYDRQEVVVSGQVTNVQLANEGLYTAVVTDSVGPAVSQAASSAY